MTRLAPCSPCRSNSLGAAYQDAIYGKGIRVHNVTGPKRHHMLRCTVCGEEKEPQEEVKP